MGVGGNGNFKDDGVMREGAGLLLGEFTSLQTVFKRF